MAIQNKKLKNPPRVLNKNLFGFFKEKRKRDIAFLVIILLVYSIADTWFMTWFFNTSIYGKTLYWTLPSGAYWTAVAFSIALLIVVDIVVCIIFFKKKDKKDINDGISYLVSEKKAYKIVNNFSSVSDIVVTEEKKFETVQELDEDGNPIIYAEEIFDDEDDIFVNEALSSTIQKEKEKTFKEIIESFDESLTQFGLKGNLATTLLASMSFSPIIYSKSIRSYIPKFFKAINNPNYVIHYRGDQTIANEKLLFKSFEFAKENQDLPVFIYIDNIPSKEFLNYLRPIYAYIDNPNDDYYLSSEGMTYYIPHNLYFLVDLADGEEIYNISRRYLRYISILNASITEIEPVSNAKSFVLSRKDLGNAKRNAQNDYSLTEQTYKKLDNFFNVINTANGYVLQNKIQRRIEESSSLLLSLGVEEDNVVDEILANNVIQAALITTEPQKLVKEFNLSRLLDDEFGEDKMKQTKAVIKEYISLYAAKGGK